MLVELPQVDRWGVEAHGGALFIDKPIKLNGQTVVIDIENNQDGSCAGIGLTLDGRNIYFYPHGCSPSYFDGARLVGHNIKYDVQMLRKWGFNVNVNQIEWDTQITAYVQNSTTNLYGLKDLVKQRFGITYPTYHDLCGKGKKAVSIGTLPTGVIANYNGMDCLSTYKLYITQLNELTDDQLTYIREIELPTAQVICEMEERGILIDTAYIRDLDKRFEDEISGVVSRIRNVVGVEFNPNSPLQVKRALLDKAGLRLSSTAAEELTKHQEVPLVADLLRYRALAKLKGTYTEGLIERANGSDKYSLHARFNQTVTQTGRLSSSDPNLQNIPTRTTEGDAIRQGFISGC